MSAGEWGEAVAALVMLGGFIWIMVGGLVRSWYYPRETWRDALVAAVDMALTMVLAAAWLVVIAWVAA